ncbi:hypothetical protein V6N13_030957 [Hibiscus sabdariffa]|uniref:Uncharacterized protein n=1 Tax=Hibiscus sabdariffa TaxID=183260 RepID=A0ABR2CLS1_9ROSI
METDPLLEAQQASEMSLSNITYLEQIEKHYDSMTRILTKLEAQNAKLKDGSDELKQLRTENARLRDESLDLASQLLEVKENMVELKSLFKSNTKEISRTHKETQQLSQHVGTQSSLSESSMRQESVVVASRFGPIEKYHSYYGT